jgi:ureidoacrylate peracid hydrolase
VITIDLSRARAAVLVIDMQAVFVSPDGPFANDTAGPLIERLNGFLSACRALGLPIVHCDYVLRNDLADAGLLRDNPAALHFTDASPFAGGDPRVLRAAGEPTVRHHRPGCFFRSSLSAVLRGLGVDTVVLTGVSVNNAISTTAREAFAHDIPALVVRDCVGAAPWEPAELFDAYVDALGTWTAEVADALDVLKRLRLQTGYFPRTKAGE